VKCAAQSHKLGISIVERLGDGRKWAAVGIMMSGHVLLDNSERCVGSIAWLTCVNNRIDKIQTYFSFNSLILVTNGAKG
jgi:hypothetical protein